jgi:uncharacterized protein (TIGR02246 family)
MRRLLLAVLLLCALPALAQDARVAEVRAFNQKFTEAIRRMDNDAILAMWADDGVSLLPGQAALRGKPAIAKMMNDVNKQFPGFKVAAHDNDFQDLVVSGDWATEWATTHQVAQPPDGKPPLDIWGKMLLILHRQANGEWKIERESWTSGH